MAPNIITYFDRMIKRGIDEERKNTGGYLRWIDLSQLFLKGKQAKGWNLPTLKK